MISLLKLTIIIVAVSILAVLGRSTTVDAYAGIVELASEIHMEETAEEASSNEESQGSLSTAIVHIDGNPVEVGIYHRRQFNTYTWIFMRLSIPN